MFVFFCFSSQQYDEFLSLSISKVYSFLLADVLYFIALTCISLFLIATSTAIRFTFAL